MLIWAERKKFFFLLYFSISFPANISTPDQRCFNGVDQRWNNVDLTLKMKQNPTSDLQRCTTLIQRRCPTLKQRWIKAAQSRYNYYSTLYNVISTLLQRWYTIISTLFQRGLNFSWSYIETNLASEKYGFANRIVTFILLGEKIFFKIY